MNEQRPDADELLKRVKEEEARAGHGTLRVFFGAAAGVGKTYAMLLAAHEQRENNVDVVVGWVETHGRVETEALLEGLEILPPRVIEYRDAQLKEFDLDAALRRRPTLILVDELAHTNVPGSRHPKRWHDVRELLDAGINVYTTVNVQHLESLNDIVTQITGVAVHETVPDSVFAEADDVELIDIPPDDLRQRLKDGKVYMPDQAQQAITNFFRKGNLIALRELALRRTADRVDEQMRRYRRDHAVPETWPAAETVMVCVNLHPRGVRLVRAAKRIAEGLHAKWVAVYVQTPEHLRLPDSERDRVEHTLRLAEQLGAETVTLRGARVGQEILSYARTRNVTKIVVGKPLRSRLKELVFGSVVNDLVNGSGEIDVYVITGETAGGRPLMPRVFRRTSPWSAYAKGAGVVALTTGVAALTVSWLSHSNIPMVYLLGVLFVAASWGRGPAVLAAALSVLSYDFFFVEPYLTMSVSDPRELITFVVLFVTALVTGTLTVMIREQAEAARQGEQRTAALYAMSRELMTYHRVANLASVAARHIQQLSNSQVAVLLPDAEGHLTLQTGEEGAFVMEAKDAGVAQWVVDHGQRAGLGTETLPDAGALYLPLIASRGVIGVLAVRPDQPRRLLAPDQMHLLEAFTNQVAAAIERVLLAEEAQRAQLTIETERMRNAVLNAVSHDLRTPLATIVGATSSLLEENGGIDREGRKGLLRAAHDEAIRLDRLVNNLLAMTRVEAGALKVEKEWLPLEEVIGAALVRVEDRLGRRVVSTTLPSDAALVLLDGVLIEQVLINLLDNAIKYTPQESPIDLSAEMTRDGLNLAVADRGPGIPPGDLERIFDKFYRAAAIGAPGVGLGLSICRGIVEAHGGRMWAENRPGGGAVFRFVLPMTGGPPRPETVFAEPQRAS
jgi:two-component system sensor histidine kinase KdpD